ncbi:MAG: YbaB/EbfC family nucleoid-associated protein [Bacilli bacterium]
MNMQALMAQAQKMQKDIMNKKEEINKKLFTGKSELVEVVFNGKKEMVSITINKNSSLDAEDLEVLEDMIKIAINDSLNQIDKEVSDKLGAYSSQLNGLL